MAVAIDHYIRKQILELACECILPANANLQSANAMHYEQIAKNKAEIEATFAMLGNMLDLVNQLAGRIEVLENHHGKLNCG